MNYWETVNLWLSRISDNNVSPVCAFLAVLGALCYFKTSSSRGLQRQSEAIVTTISKANE